MTQEMIAYYAQRAAEYDRVYEMPRWQDDRPGSGRERRGFWAFEYRVG